MTSLARNRNPTAIDLSKGGSLLAYKTEVLGRSQLQAWLDQALATPGEKESVLPVP